MYNLNSSGFEDLFVDKIVVNYVENVAFSIDEKVLNAKCTQNINNFQCKSFSLFRKRKRERDCIYFSIEL